MDHSTALSRAWECINQDFHTQRWLDVAAVSVAPTNVMVVEHHNYARKMPETLLGFPLQIDPSLPVDEVRLVDGDGQVLRMINVGCGSMVKIKTEVIKGTHVANFVPPPYYAVQTPGIKSRIEFGVHFDRVEFSGTCETKQDLRDALRELLAQLEAE